MRSVVGLIYPDLRLVSQTDIVQKYQLFRINHTLVHIQKQILLHILFTLHLHCVHIFYYIFRL